MLGKLGNITKAIPKPFKKIGSVGLGMGLTAAFALPEALAGFKYEYDDNAKKVDGINWKCGGKATLKSVARVLGFGVIGGAVGAAFAGCSAVVAAPLAIAGLYLGWVKSSEILAKLFKNEGEVVRDACKAKNIAYDPTVKESNPLGSVTNPEGAMA